MKSLVPIAALGALLAGAIPASAQIAANSKAPVDITADELETHNSECIAIWRGNAEALQDTARLRADVLRLFNEQGVAKPGSQSTGCGDLKRMEAEGSVYYVTADQKVRANKAVYEAGSTTITMTGDVVAVKGQNVLRGDRMVFNTQTGEGQMIGGAKGRDAKDRPRGVFYPSQNQDAQNSPQGGQSASKPAQTTSQSKPQPKSQPK
jgi:lipopolysaccharide export system protein LptA